MSASCRVAIALICGAAGFGAAPSRADDGCAARRMVRVELFFGGAIGDRAWRRFVASIVSPRLPEGLTWSAVHGEWRGPHGRQRESAHVIVYLTPLDAAENARIEAVRRLYRLQFHQQSVLRADTPACVSF